VTATYPEHFERYPPAVDCDSLSNHGWTAGAIAMAGIWAVLIAISLAGSILGRIKRRREQRRRKGLAVPDISPPSQGWRCWFTCVGKECLMCFDVHRNWRVLSRRGPPKAGVDLSVLNGLRVLSMVFIILGHTTSYGEWFNSVAYPSVALAPYLVNQSFFNNWWLGIFFFGWYAVDTFLFVGGVVCGSRASLQIEALKRRQEKITSRPGRVLTHAKFWALFIFGRYLRLLPVLVMVLFTAWQLVPSLGQSPWWEKHWDVFTAASAASTCCRPCSWCRTSGRPLGTQKRLIPRPPSAWGRRGTLLWTCNCTYLLPPSCSVSGISHPTFGGGSSATARTSGGPPPRCC